MENIKCSVLIAGREGYNIILWKIKLIGKLNNWFTQERFRESVLLKHGFKIPCKNEDSIHVDYKEYLVCCESE